MSKVKITSQVEHRVRIYIPELRVNRLFSANGQSYLFDEETVEEMFYYPSVESLFKEGLFTIEDKKLRIRLGLEEENGTVAETVTAPISDTTISAYLKVKPIGEFKEFVSELPKSQQNRFVDMAILNKITDYEKCSFLKEITGRDIIKVIQLNEEPNE
jgi:hypothetical protein